MRLIKENFPRRDLLAGCWKEKWDKLAGVGKISPEILNKRTTGRNNCLGAKTLQKKIINGEESVDIRWREDEQTRQCLPTSLDSGGALATFKLQVPSSFSLRAFSAVPIGQPKKCQGIKVLPMPAALINQWLAGHSGWTAPLSPYSWMGWFWVVHFVLFPRTLPHLILSSWPPSLSCPISPLLYCWFLGSTPKWTTSIWILISGSASQGTQT